MIRVEYGVTTLGAKEGFVPELLNCAEISNADNLSKDNLSFENFVNPCEKYSALLDGSTLPIPQDTSDKNIGVWSLDASNEIGIFENTFPTITLVSDNSFDVYGLSLKFDTINNIYPTRFKVSWYNNDTFIMEKQYSPVSATFSLMDYVQGFNKIVMVFYEMSTPYSRLKLHSIDYGSILTIEERNIQNMQLYQAVDPISTVLPISTLNLYFLNSQNANYNFAAKQSLKIYDGDILVGKYFIESARQINKQQWNIKAQDYIDILEETVFEGGIYFDEPAINVLNSIFNRANVPFMMDDKFSDENITGYIPYTNCRKALQQVLFAIGGYVNTAYSEVVNVLTSTDDVVESIGFDRILQGQTMSVDADITEIKLFGHKYTSADDEIVLYKAETEQEEIKIIFNSPMHDLAIEKGEIKESGTNYAVISCQEGGLLKGKVFDHLTFSKTRYNTATSNMANNNKKAIKNATLISSHNIDKILDICYNYLVRNKSIKSKIIELGNPLIVGKMYEIETELLGKMNGVLTEQDFSLFGGKKVVKKTVIK